MKPGRFYTRGAVVRRDVGPYVAVEASCASRALARRIAALLNRHGPTVKGKR